jgi:type IV secretion system protein VirB9
MRVIIPALLAVCAVSQPALALCDVDAAQPAKSCVRPGKLDPHMVTAAYDPAQVYAIHVPQGQTLALTLSPDETATDGFGADKNQLRADISGNVVIYGAGDTPVQPRPLFVRSRSLDGTRQRTYALMVDTRPVDTAEVSFTFTYPGEVSAAAAAAWRQAKAQREQKAVAAQLAAAQGHMEGDSNVKYVLQGKTAADWNLLPTREVSDNGRDTHFRFPGNMQVPIIYAADADGKNPKVVQSDFNSETGVATVHVLSPAFHLVDGDTLLCVFNRAYDPIGVRSATGTISPDIERVTR